MTQIVRPRAWAAPCRLAHSAWDHSSLATPARPHVMALSETDETVHLAQLDHAQVLYVDKANARDPLEMFSAAAKSGPPIARAWEVMMAHLTTPNFARSSRSKAFTASPNTFTTAEALTKTTIRAAGYGFDRRARAKHHLCGCPNLSHSGRVLGALSVTSSTARTSLAKLAHVPIIQKSAQAIAQEAADGGFRTHNHHNTHR